MCVFLLLLLSCPVPVVGSYEEVKVCRRQSIKKRDEEDAQHALLRRLVQFAGVQLS